MLYELYTIEDALNKLFCTFTDKSELDSTIQTINANYTILYSRIFVLEIPDSTEYVCTYNIDTNNIVRYKTIPSTILMHRRKETDTLYTINSLNLLISELNNGVLDKNYKVNWDNYKHSILLTRAGKLTKLNTKLIQIVPLN